MHLNYLVSGSRSLKKNWVWVPCPRVSLNSNQLLIDYSNKRCASIDLAYLVERKPLQIKGFVVILLLMYFFWHHVEYFPVSKTLRLRGDDSM